jgi:hypothetical protein
MMLLVLTVREIYAKCFAQTGAKPVGDLRPDTVFDVAEGIVEENAPYLTVIDFPITQVLHVKETDPFDESRSDKEMFVIVYNVIVSASKRIEQRAGATAHEGPFAALHSQVPAFVVNVGTCDERHRVVDILHIAAKRPDNEVSLDDFVGYHDVCFFAKVIILFVKKTRPYGGGAGCEI